MPEAMDYRHRPAKNIERHLIVEACRRVMSNAPGQRYQYVGFGALEFIDFQLMHRSLGINKMVSIEKSASTRHEFNKPFKSIKIMKGQSSEVLKGGDLDLSTPTIIWMDYTSGLTKEVISDLVDIGRSIATASFVLVTVNAHPTTPIDERLTKFSLAVGHELVPPGTTDETLAQDGVAKAQRLIVDAVMHRAISERKEDLSWMQTMHVNYRDGARMQTIAGMVVPSTTSRKSIDTLFRDLQFYRPGDDYLDLRVPVITTKERAILDRQLPKRAATPLVFPGIAAKDLEAYRNVYRYLHLVGLQSAAETTWVN